MTTENKKIYKGIVTAVMGPVVDVGFDGTYMPKIHEKLIVKTDENYISLEVFSHLNLH